MPPRRRPQVRRSSVYPLGLSSDALAGGAEAEVASAARGAGRLGQVESTEAGLGDVAGSMSHAVVEAGMGELMNAAPYMTSRAERPDLADLLPNVDADGVAAGSEPDAGLKSCMVVQAGMGERRPLHVQQGRVPRAGRLVSEHRCRWRRRRLWAGRRFEGARGRASNWQGQTRSVGSRPWTARLAGQSG